MSFGDEMEKPVQSPVRNGKSWIQTATGKRFEIFDPSIADIDIADIGHALSNLCRYTGHCARFYSVAEHCVRVSFRCEELARKMHEGHVEVDCPMCLKVVQRAARWGLLHDAAEAYVNDLNRPLKHQPELSRYRAIERKLMDVIAERFNLGPEPDEVAVADDELLWTEVRDIMQPLHPDWKGNAIGSVREPLAHVSIACWYPDKARNMFFRRFNQLFPEFSPKEEP